MVGVKLYVWYIWLRCDKLRNEQDIWSRSGEFEILKHSERNMCTVGKENMNIVSTAWNWPVPGKATPGWVLSFHAPIATGWLCKIPPHIQETVGFGILYLSAKYSTFDFGQMKINSVDFVRRKYRMIKL